MSTHTTIGWYHNGYLVNRAPQAVTSPEHRRRLQYVHDMARGIINTTLAAISAGAKLEPLQTQPLALGIDRGWRRITTGTVEVAPSGFVAVRQALGEVSLTLADFDRVKEGSSDGNEATQLLLATIAEEGFQDPLGLLNACPVVGLADSSSGAPAARQAPRTDGEDLFRLLPGVIDLSALPPTPAG